MRLFHCRSLTAAGAVLLLGLCSLGGALSGDMAAPRYLGTSAAIAGLVIVLGGLGFWNLARDVGRGYSPARCSLAALLLLLGLAPAVITQVVVLSALLRR